VIRVLEVAQLRVEFGGVVAVADASFGVASGEAVGLIGPNGAGKSTTIDAITGFVRPAKGRITVGGVDVAGWSPQRIHRQQVARTFQSAEIAGGMTVEQNLMIASWGRGGGRCRHAAARRRAAEVAELLGVRGYLGVPGSVLPYGIRRLVEIARAMMQRPRLVLLDEPGAGLTELERTELVPVLRRLVTGGLAIVLVDHHVSFVAQSCERLVVLDAGTVIATGTPAQVRSDPAVIAAYLGKSG
jgi:branched-chain amino acid transport system ATP-binding protein